MYLVDMHVKHTFSQMCWYVCVRAHFREGANEIFFAKSKAFACQKSVLRHYMTNEVGSLCSWSRVIFLFVFLRSTCVLTVGKIQGVLEESPCSRLQANNRCSALPGGSSLWRHSQWCELNDTTFHSAWFLLTSCKTMSTAGFPELKQIFHHVKQDVICGIY